ncbi:hypothetical protein JRI60_25615 [Archangium violaceum]|uniref:hypothetical protein n=1 Tax=Archangium violaceum TaxID=83451 RepID=UPI001950C3FB|nr:hypothetical protein [Archangium violaceum]QRO02148.1 hypothetical protein JRI60_25615 [Archangium violaceum]
MKTTGIRSGIRWMSLLLSLAGVGQAAAEPLQEGNVLISTGNSVYEYTREGAWVRTLPVPYPTGTRPATEYVRDMVVDADGNLQVYNGTFDPYLSRYDVAVGGWDHSTYAGWSTANNVSYGGIARHGDSVFVTDMMTYGTGDEPKGLVRFNLLSGGAQRFADTVDFIDVTVGLDGLVYGLAYDEYRIYVYDPNTLAQVRTLSLPFGLSIRGIAVSKTGEIYGASWNDSIYRFSSTGAQLGVVPTGAYDLTDIDLSEDGTLVAGSRFGKIIFTDLTLSGVRSFSVGGSEAFVTFVPPGGPSLGTDNLLVSSANSLTEYTSSGSLVRSVPISSNDRARDLIVSAKDRVEIYNGTFDPYLSRYDVGAESWVHWTYAGWSTANNVSYGGIASHGDSVFVTDMMTYGTGDEPKGLVRFNLLTGGAQRFADTVDFIDVTVGLDGLVYGLAYDEYRIYVYDPVTLAQVRTISLPFNLSIRGIAVSKTGEIYGASWNDSIYRFSSTGVQLAVVPTGVYDLIDIDISPSNAQVAVGSRFGTVILTDLSLGNLRSFSAGSSEAFVSFTVPAFPSY